MDKARRKIKRVWIYLSSLILILAAAAAFIMLHRPKPETVVLTTVSARTLQNTLFETGTVKPVQRQIIYGSQIAGQAQDFKVNIGDHVKKGQILFSVLGQSGLYDVKSTITGEVIIKNESGVSFDGTPAPLIEVVGNQKQIVVNVSEIDAVQIHKSMSATVSSDAFPGKTFSAVVSYVADYALQNSSGSGQVEVDLNPKGSFPIPIGYQVDIHITSSPHKAAVSIPYNALVQSGDTYVVFRYENGKVSTIPVTLGITTDNYVEVTKGLHTGDKIITNPSPNLKSGEAVRIS